MDALAALEATTLGARRPAGRFPSAALGCTAYADPARVFPPGRYLIVAYGLATVPLCFPPGRWLPGDRVGLIVAAWPAIAPTRIRYSRIIRTDMSASVAWSWRCAAWRRHRPATADRIQRRRARNMVLPT